MDFDTTVVFTFIGGIVVSIMVIKYIEWITITGVI